VPAAQQLHLPHPGPADRYLAATAQVLGLTVRSDDALSGLGEIATLANRRMQQAKPSAPPSNPCPTQIAAALTALKQSNSMHAEEN
jgi:hypothetical protein